MRVWFGGGTWVDVPSGVEFGIQAKGGAEWFMPWAPWGVFAEILPGINFLNPHGSDVFSGNIGARYYFLYLN